MAAIGQTRPAATTIRTPLFVVGVALALVAFLVMLALGIIFVNRSGPVGTVRLVVTNQDIGARVPIPADALTYSVIPLNAAPPHAFLRAGDLSGYAALVPIYKGQVITDNMVSATPDIVPTGQQAYLPIPKGYVAITIPMGEQIGVAGYISQGDHIDVIAQLNTSLFSPVNPHPVARTVFTDLPVIRVGPESAAPKQGQAQGVASSLTVLMSQCDAQYMAWLSINATLKYTLLSYKDYSSTTPPADAGCPPTSLPAIVGPAEIDARWAMTRS